MDQMIIPGATVEHPIFGRGFIAWHDRHTKECVEVITGWEEEYLAPLKELKYIE